MGPRTSSRPTDAGAGSCTSSRGPARLPLSPARVRLTGRGVPPGRRSSRHRPAGTPTGRGGAWSDHPQAGARRHAACGTADQRRSSSPGEPPRFGGVCGRLEQVSPAGSRRASSKRPRRDGTTAGGSRARGRKPSVLGSGRREPCAGRTRERRRPHPGPVPTTGATFRSRGGGGGGLAGHHRRAPRILVNAAGC
jgi:hypothetical protein